MPFAPTLSPEAGGGGKRIHGPGPVPSDVDKISLYPVPQTKWYIATGGVTRSGDVGDVRFDE
jgi:hypothetical protein